MTLWVSQPMYAEVIYWLERVPAVEKERPEPLQEGATP